MSWSRRIVSLSSRAPGVTRAFLASTRPRRFLVLCYHRVNDDAHPFFTGIPVALFRRQMEALRRHFTVLPLAELAERARRKDLPRNGVAVTFDDGYRDNYTNAFPVLRDLGLPATIFLTTDSLDRNALLWHDRVFDAFHRTRKAEARASFATVLARLRRSSPEDRDAVSGEVPKARSFRELGERQYREVPAQRLHLFSEQGHGRSGEKRMGIVVHAVIAEDEKPARAGRSEERARHPRRSRRKADDPPGPAHY